ncbi:MAG: four helix bundle protein [Elusimicrobia bacterium]|nr:four helix bundle protein [Elusimicrobiota bacterium]
MKIERFEDIIAWQKARELTLTIYKLSENGILKKDFDLKSQMRRAAISVMANIAEGYGRKTDKEFANFLNIAHGSLAELQSHLYLAVDLKYVDKENFDKLYKLADETSRLLSKFAKYLSSSASFHIDSRLKTLDS